MPHHADLPRRRRPARGDHDGHHGPQCARGGRRAAARPGPRLHRPQRAAVRRAGRGRHPGRRQARGRGAAAPVRHREAQEQRPATAARPRSSSRARSASRRAPTARPTSTAKLDSPHARRARRSPRSPVTEVLLVGTKKRPEQRADRRRPQLGGAGQLRVRRQPAGLQLGRPVLRAVPVHGEHLARRRRRRAAVPGQRLASRPTGRRSSTTAAAPGQWPVCGHYLFTLTGDRRPGSAARPGRGARAGRPARRPAHQDARARTSSSTPTRCGASCAPPRSAPTTTSSRSGPASAR